MAAGAEVVAGPNTEVDVALSWFPKVPNVNGFGACPDAERFWFVLPNVTGLGLDIVVAPKKIDSSYYYNNHSIKEDHNY